MNRWAPLLAAWLVLRTTAPAAAATTLGQPQYQQTLHSIRLQVDGYGSHGPPTAAQISRIRAALERLARVRLSDGRTISTDTPQLARRLDPREAVTLTEIVPTIDALDDALGSTPQHAANSSQLRILDDVLRDPRFRQGQNPVQDLEDWLGSQLNKLLHRAGADASGSVTDVIFGVLFLGLVAGTALLMVRGALGRLTVSVDREEAAGEPVTALSAEERVAAEVAAGDYRTALRYLFLATMLYLQEHDVLELQPGLTNRDYWRILRGQSRKDLTTGGDIAAPLGALVDEFDRAWYGHKHLSAHDYEHCRSLAEDIRQLATRRAA